MKRLFLALAFFPTILIGSERYQQDSNWDVVSSGGQFFVENKREKGLRYPVELNSGLPKFLGRKKIPGRDIALLVYESGQVGTSEIVRIIRAVAYAPDKRKFYGDFPYQVKYTNRDKKNFDTETKYIFSDDHFEIRDESTGFFKKVWY